MLPDPQLPGSGEGQWSLVRPTSEEQGHPQWGVIQWHEPSVTVLSPAPARGLVHQPIVNNKQIICMLMWLPGKRGQLGVWGKHTSSEQPDPLLCSLVGFWPVSLNPSSPACHCPAP